MLRLVRIAPGCDFVRTLLRMHAQAPQREKSWIEMEMRTSGFACVDVPAIQSWPAPSSKGFSFACWLNIRSFADPLQAFAADQQRQAHGQDDAPHLRLLEVQQGDNSLFAASIQQTGSGKGVLHVSTLAGEATSKRSKKQESSVFGDFFFLPHIW
jgi:hypothetical protein